MDFRTVQTCCGENMKHLGSTLLIAVTACLLPPPAYAQTTSKTASATSVQAPVSPTPPTNITRVSFIQSMDAEFKSRDGNADAKVSRTEIEEFERRAAVRKSQIDNSVLFARLDTDQNKLITATEFQRLITSPTLPDISSIMQRFDKNRDQQITIVEYRIATLMNFDDLDADKDGAVNEIELRASEYKEKNMEQNR